MFTLEFRHQPPIQKEKPSLEEVLEHYIKSMDAYLPKQEEKSSLEDMMMQQMQRIDAFLQEQDALIRNLEYQVCHLATIINHPEGTFHSNTDSTPEEKHCTTITCSGLYDDESIFEIQEKEGDGRNTTIQSDVKHM
ncbi:hypothetical protein PanWU01x14_300640 [Parasponia andersonii]|uniref:Uncharacterized protein n=1 Tax=Parasponia andersonii TaxID=3476 RepID=A0A2P5ATV7_PARAD|nr:hypothetical protein PanWU01x14_300640 [Parasponia andersonii]